MSNQNDFIGIAIVGFISFSVRSTLSHEMYHPCSALPRRELLTVALLTVSLGVGHVHAFGGVASNAHDSVGSASSSSRSWT